MKVATYIIICIFYIVITYTVNMNRFYAVRKQHWIRWLFTILFEVQMHGRQLLSKFNKPRLCTAFCVPNGKRKSNKKTLPLHTTLSAKYYITDLGNHPLPYPWPRSAKLTPLIKVTLLRSKYGTTSTRIKTNRTAPLSYPSSAAIHLVTPVRHFICCD